MYFKEIWKVAKTFLKGQLKKQAEDIFCREEEKNEQKSLAFKFIIHRTTKS